jgi:membrane protease YdiL (CAAX protease family)
MTPFQQHALLLIAIWLLLIAVRFRRSTVVLTGGLFIVGIYTLFAIETGGVSPQQLGFVISIPGLALSVAWLALMLAYSPMADWVATRFTDKPPTLGAFRAIQQSRIKLIGGIVVAWILGGFLEALLFRGIVLRSVAVFLGAWMTAPVADAIAVCAAATGAGIIHLYQGPRAAIVVTQLSVLFGVLFVLSGYNLWAVIVCHGLYDTVAFIRFATKKSRYAQFATQP